MKQHFLASIKNHPWEWAGCFAMVGWLLSRIPAHKQKIYIDSYSQKPVQRRDKGPLSKVWKEIWQFSKPMIAAYLAKLLMENAKSPESK
jgi:O-antigen/teichoic acid export membrane protein